MFATTRKATDGSLLGSLPWTLLALGVSLASHVPYLPIWITVTCVACAALRLQIERRRWRLPGPLVRMGLALFCFLGVLGTYETISGVGPGSALLAVMAALKLLETARRRDQFVLLFLSIFLIMASLLREQYVWSLPYLLTGVLVTMMAWLQMSASRGVSVRQALGNSARLIAYSIPLMIAMWILFPRIGTPLWSVPIDTSSGVTGLSDEMSPGDISSLSQSDAVAFRVRFEGDAPEPKDRYWRGLVLHRFNGRSWTGSEPTLGDRDDMPIDYLGSPLSYEITMEPTRQHWVLALDLPYEWSLDMTYMGRRQQLARAQPVDQRVVYTAVSYPEFRVETEINRFWHEYYRRLPDGSNPRTQALAIDMRSQAGSDRAYINAVMQMFNREAYFYTLQPPALGRNPVDEFLFNSQRGFCEHYASAFSVMMRAAGIPARVVIGYQGGEVNPMSDYMIVRQSDAHAWTEVWLNGDGWTRVDPTSAVAPERIETGMSGAMFDGIGASWGLSAPTQLMHRLTLVWDMVNEKWNAWILAYGPDKQESFLEWLGMDEPDLRKMLLALVALIAIMLAGVTGLLALRYRPPRRDAPHRLYRSFVRRTGIKSRRGEPPLEFLSRLASSRPELTDEANDITRAYLEARYGPPASRDVDELRRLLRTFRPPRPAKA